LKLRSLICSGIGLSVLLCPIAHADHADPLPGHSVHGDTFDEGPRRGAYLMGNTGNVHFPVTGLSKEAQEFFDQGIGQLHGFWYLEAERSFRQVAAIDPECPMAYWGMAMANLTNAKRAKGFIEEAVKKQTAAQSSERENKWISALADFYKDKSKESTRKKNYVDALARLMKEYPDDIEAKAFYVRYAWEYRASGEVKLDNEGLDKVMQEIFKAAPDHPAHHFRIHWWDDKDAKRAITAAAMCGPAATAIAHMWHMPGHTYSKLNRYEDAAWQQEASTRTDHAYMIRDRVMPYEIHNYAHNNEWLVRDLVFVGRVGDAIDLSKNMIELPRHPKYNASSNRGSGAEYGRARLIDVLSQHEMWPQFISLCKGVYLQDEEDAEQELRKLRYLGVALAATGDAAGAKQQITAIEKLKKKAIATAATQPATAPSTTQPSTPQPVVKQPAASAKLAAAPSTRPATRPVVRGRGGPANNPGQSMDQAIAHIQAHLALAAGDAKKGAELLAKADARKEHQSQAQLAAGDKAKAESLARDAVNQGKGQTYPLANQVLVLHAIGKTEEAKQAFEKLREIADYVDLSVAPYSRLGSIAKEFGFGDDWRSPRVLPKDLGKRPALSTLGPFRWSPWTAPTWEAKGANGQPLSLSQYRGKPVIVVFYLGHGCLHCTQQLHAFIPAAKEFAAAGISIVAVSTDSPEDLNKAWEGAKLDGGAIPFPLVSDPKLEIFKAYRVYDDFEKSSLHATFLIDGQGKIRWQDISYQPFMDTKFLVKESKRLLAQDLTAAAAAK
jgi:peroxiredoxin